MFNKKKLLSLSAFAMTLSLCLVSMHIMSLFTIPYWLGVTIALGIFCIMLILLIALRKNKIMHCLVIPVNAIASGIALSSMYVYLESFPLVWQSACVFAALIVAFAVYCLLANIPFFNNHYVVCIAIYLLLLITAAALGMVFSDIIPFSLAMVELIPVISYLISLVLPSKDGTDHIKNLAYCSFAAFIFVIFAVLAVITQGDALDSLVPTGSDKNKNKNPYGFIGK